MSAITVKVGTVPGRIDEVALEDGASVQDALDEAGFSDTANYTVKLNGRNVRDADEETIRDGDKVLLLKNVNAG